MQNAAKQRDRGKQLRFWLSHEEVAAIRALAERSGLRNPTNWIRYHTLRELRRQRKKAA
jgi:hypothetical protein